MKVFGMLKHVMIVGLFCLTLASCGKETEEDVRQEADGTVGDISSSSSDKTGEEGFSQKLDENGLLQGDALPLIGKAFGELPVVGGEDAVYCNLPENVTSWESVVPLCVDPLYGILYYVDYGGDYMIHAIYNGESQLAVELPGRRLFCRGGKLYFLLDAYNQFRFEGAQSGNVAEYDPVTGTVTLLSDKQFTSMVVYQDLIYCRQLEESIEYEEGRYIDVANNWFYFFDTNKLVMQEKSEQEDEEEQYALSFRRYGEYFMADVLKKYDADPRYNIRTGIELRKWNGERGIAWDGLQPSSSYYIKEGSLYWLGRDGFHICNLGSGQDKVYPWDFENGEQYILTNNRFFNVKFQLINMEDGSSTECHSADEVLKSMHELYTDGDEVYAIVGSYTSKVDTSSVLRRVRMIQGEEGYDVLFEALQ